MFLTKGKSAILKICARKRDCDVARNAELECGMGGDENCVQNSVEGKALKRLAKTLTYQPMGRLGNIEALL